MKRVITKEHALKLVKKLKAKVVSDGAHNRAYVYEGDVLIASFGIRMGSEKDKGHDFIPRELFLGPRDARDLANCPLKREQWLKILQEKGEI